MNPVLVKSSIFMGMYTNNKSGEVPIDKSWWRNDGVVSVISAINPKVGSTDKIVDYSGTAVKVHGIILVNWIIQIILRFVE